MNQVGRKRQKPFAKIKPKRPGGVLTCLLPTPLWLVLQRLTALCLPIKQKQNMHTHLAYRPTKEIY
ncbi:MAG: hypothetical protein EAY75_16905 [Bacteroidetes bacterium]|nr:MAG: hypothetical protein EAY75_16905 [Bacteroidota bacterium]